MKKNISFLILVSICVLLSVSCASGKIYALQGIAMPGEEVSVVEGATIISANTPVLTISAASGYILNGQGSVLISILNNSDNTYYFSDNDINIYAGDKNKNDWKLLTNWDAEKYIKRETRKQNSRKTFSAILGTVLVLDSIFNSKPVTADISYGWNAGIVSGIVHTGEALIYPDVLLAGMVANLQYELFTANGQNYLEFVTSNSLKSGYIPKDEQLAGCVFFDDWPKYNDYMVEVVDKKSGVPAYFLFSKTE